MSVEILAVIGSAVSGYICFILGMVSERRRVKGEILDAAATLRPVRVAGGRYQIVDLATYEVEFL